MRLSDRLKQNNTVRSAKERGPRAPIKPLALPKNVVGWIRYTANHLAAANLCFASGMQEPYLEAEYLVLHAFSIPLSLSPARYPPPPANAESLIKRVLYLRIDQRLPAPYVTQEAFFAGRTFFVDERVLIPRSRIENMIDDPVRFTPWLEDQRVLRILDLGTGSGCLAISLALAFPLAQVDAVDLSLDALAVAKINCDHFKLQKRVRLLHSDLFSGLGGERYDLIVTNPPYVPEADFQQLPPEYQREPAMALRAGFDGLDLLGPILRQAPQHLTPGGLLVCETGDDVETIMMNHWPDLPVEWILFHFGASGVFAVLREPLAAWSMEVFDR